MLRLLIGLFLTLATILTLSACVPASKTSLSSTSNLSPDGKTPESTLAPDTQFSRMFDLVPYSFLKEHDIWFGDPGKARQIHGFGNINSLEAYDRLSEDERKQMAADLRGIIQIGWKYPDLISLTGYDSLMVNSLILVGTPPPWKFAISEGDFDTALVEQKLSEQGYEKKTHGSYTYYSQFDDFQMVPANPINNIVMADLNRIAVVDNKVITAPATSILTAILDTMAKNSESVMDNAACRSLTASLGEVISGGIITPERIIDPAPGHSANLPLFEFDVPADWGLLHQYEMVGMGYKDDGQERFWVISLYYANGNHASADADTLAKRMASYQFNTQYKDRTGAALKVSTLSDRFDVSTPLVRAYGKGATLTVECRFRPEIADSAWLQPTYMLRDLLFLSPDPAPYIKKK